MDKPFFARLCKVRHAAAVAIAATASLPAGAEAQEWRFEPELKVGLEWDDNARLRSDPAQQQEIEGYILDGSLGIGYNTQRTMFRLEPRLRSRVYDEEPDVDSDDQFLEATWMHETLKGNFGVRGSFSRESVRTAERADADLDEIDPDEIPTDETGLVLTNDRRERLRIAPEWNYDLTERMGIGLKAVYTDVSYDDAIANFLVDYTDTRLEAVLSRELSPRTRGYVGVATRQYENDRNNDVDGVGAVVGIATELSETTQFQVEAGYEDTERDLTGESDSNFVANVNLVRQLETVTLLAQYRRNVAAGGSGRVTARDTFNFNVKKRFSERLNGGVGVRAYQTEDIGDQPITLQERDYLQFHASLGYALTRAVSVEADYRHARLDRAGAEGSADANSIILWLVYRPTPIIR